MIVLSYPRLFMGEDCNAGTFFSPEEEARLNTTADMLRDKIRAAATRAGTNFVFKDAIPPFIGHAVCDSVDVAQRPLEPGRRELPPEPHRAQSGYTPLVRAVLG